jgi:hypothetical protein
MAEKKKVVTNQGAINAANQQNAAAIAKAQAAQSKITELTPQATSATGFSAAAQKYIDTLSKSKALAKPFASNIESLKTNFGNLATQFQTNIFQPLTQAQTDLTQATSSFVTVPGEIYGPAAPEAAVVSTNITVLKSLLKGLGFGSALIDSSTTYLQKLLVQENLDYDNAVEVFLNSKEYSFSDGTTMTSPFYTEYGYLNEGLVNPKSARELYGAVEGYKGVIDTYKLSQKYLSSDSLKGYVKNNVTVADLAERANINAIRALEADPFQVAALQKQGFIGTSANLIDFYMDEKIGKEQLELNRQTGVFTAEALRREKAGVVASEAQLAGFKQLTATLAAKGYSEAQISQLASTGFENISQIIDPLTKYAGIYEKAGGTMAKNEELKSNIQTSLLSEEFLGTESERRKRLSEQNLRAFQGQSGTTTTSLRSPGVSGLI